MSLRIDSPHYLNYKRLYRQSSHYQATSERRMSLETSDPYVNVWICPQARSHCSGNEYNSALGRKRILHVFCREIVGKHP